MRNTVRRRRKRRKKKERGGALGAAAGLFLLPSFLLAPALSLSLSLSPPSPPPFLHSRTCSSHLFCLRTCSPLLFLPESECICTAVFCFALLTTPQRRKKNDSRTRRRGGGFWFSDRLLSRFPLAFFSSFFSFLLTIHRFISALLSFGLSLLERFAPPRLFVRCVDRLRVCSAPASRRFPGPRGRSRRRPTRRRARSIARSLAGALALTGSAARVSAPLRAPRGASSMTLRAVRRCLLWSAPADRGRGRSSRTKERRRHLKELSLVASFP